MKWQIWAAVCLFALVSMEYPLFASDIDNFNFIDLYSPDVQALMTSSYLGHQEEMPDLNEPAVVLQEYLNFDSLAYVPPSPDQLPELDQQIRTWQSLAKNYPQSRHALVGLARLYDIESSITHDSKMAGNAVDLYTEAAQIAIRNGHIRYTSQIEKLFVVLNDPDGLDAAFLPILSTSPTRDPIHYYEAQLDYAQGLSAFGDRRADMYFSLATQAARVDHTAAADLYAEYLLSDGNPSKAFEMLSTVLTSPQRLRALAPVFLRAQAARMAGISSASVHAEVAEIEHLFAGDGPIRLVRSSDVSANFVNNHPNEDCRNPALAGQWKFFMPAGYGSKLNWVIYPYQSNSAEVEFNEAGPGTLWGGVDAVGWSIRDRVAANVCKNPYTFNFDSTCAADTECKDGKDGTPFAGGCGWHTTATCDAQPSCPESCQAHLPSGDPGLSNYSKNICCAVHVGTFKVKTAQNQWNDAYVASETLYEYGYLGAIAYLEWGLLPDMSVPLASGNYWTVSNVLASSCTFSCASPICVLGRNYNPTKRVKANLYEASVNGPMEFLTWPGGNATDPGFEYQAEDPQQNWSNGDVCGGGNVFWNRCTTHNCSGPN